MFVKGYGLLNTEVFWKFFMVLDWKSSEAGNGFTYLEVNVVDLNVFETGCKGFTVGIGAFD